MSQYDEDIKLEKEMSPYFNKIYWREMKNLEFIEVVDDKYRQQTGIDKVLHINDGRKINVDEKTLRFSKGNIVLEEFSRLTTDKLGWLEKDGMQTDYIMYGFFKEKWVFMLPYPLVQAFYLENKEKWLEATQRNPQRKGEVSYYIHKELDDNGKEHVTTGFYMKWKTLFEGMDKAYQKLYGDFPTCNRLWRARRSVIPPYNFVIIRK